MWESTLSINAVTKHFHTEDDVTYTIIDIPSQAKRTKSNQYHFLFQFSKKYSIRIPMNIGTTIVFSGKLLTHRQSSMIFDNADDDLFFNFGSYGNKKLYNHIKNLSKDMVTLNNKQILLLNFNQVLSSLG